ncbi:solute symporter family protein [Saccharopolyspora erythraea]|uniref:solute symporter family protein n=1 Tax=Saccharopolyspora erythraea TaxID=1836 RepID=UPI001BA597C9|nr:cation acetate symporter [Saccharopolyspora erythraea]
MTLLVTYFASRRTETTTDFWAAGRNVSGRMNGVAIAGDFLSASSLLGYAGLAFLFGMDGLVYAVGATGAFLVVLFLLAEKMRNLGRFTFADALALRLKSRQTRAIAALSTLSIGLFYLLAQLVGAGVLMEALTGLGFSTGVVIAGLLMLAYVLFGGMLATTWVQIIKAILLMATVVFLVVLVLWQVSFNPLDVISQATQRSTHGAHYLAPGLFFDNPLDLISLGVAVTLASVGLPHVLMRFFTVPDASAARQSGNWAVLLVGVFNVLIVFLGFGARVLLDPSQEKAAGSSGNMALPMLAQELGGGPGSFGGDLLLALITAVAFTTILAVTAGLVLAAASAVAHDLWANVFHRPESEERMVGRIAACVVVGAAMLVAVAVGDTANVTFLATLATSIAASANFPVLLLTLVWKRMNTTGAIVGALFGLASALALILLSPSVWPGGEATAPWPLAFPILLSAPLGFAGCWLGSVLSKREPGDEQRFSNLQLRGLTGIGSEEAPATPDASVPAKTAE